MFFLFLESLISRFDFYSNFADIIRHINRQRYCKFPSNQNGRPLLAEECDIIWFDRTDSTNSRLAAVRDLLPSGTVFAACSQSSGRGQKGNRWISRDGENLTFSILYKADRPAVEQFRISMAVSLAVTAYLRDKKIDASVKWPNDIYAGDGKICGILIEHSVRSARLSSSIIGIGLNANQKVFDAGLPNPVSMSSILGEEFDIKRETAVLANMVVERLNAAPTSASLEKDYVNLLYHRDEWHRYADCRNAEGASLVPTTETVCGGIVFEGKIKGVSSSGLLIVEKEGGTAEEFAFKEIRYLKD